MLCAVQGFVYIKNDKDMVDPETGTASMARNTNLNEDLGKVEYVFSDKTGTLTANEMQLRELAIKGVAYGDASFKCASAADFSLNCHSATEVLNLSPQLVLCRVKSEASAESVEQKLLPWPHWAAVLPAVKPGADGSARRTESTLEAFPAS